MLPGETPKWSLYEFFDLNREMRDWGRRDISLFSFLRWCRGTSLCSAHPLVLSGWRPGRTWSLALCLLLFCTTSNHWWKTVTVGSNQVIILNTHNLATKRSWVWSLWEAPDKLLSLSLHRLSLYLVSEIENNGWFNSINMNSLLKQTH
jgi:hypothetical protein